MTTGRCIDTANYDAINISNSMVVTDNSSTISNTTSTAVDIQCLLQSPVDRIQQVASSRHQGNAVNDVLVRDGTLLKEPR